MTVAIRVVTEIRPPSQRSGNIRTLRAPERVHTPLPHVAGDVEKSEAARSERHPPERSRKTRPRLCCDSELPFEDGAHDLAARRELIPLRVPLLHEAGRRPPTPPRSERGTPPILRRRGRIVPRQLNHAMAGTVVEARMRAFGMPPNQRHELGAAKEPPALRRSPAIGPRRGIRRTRTTIRSARRPSHDLCRGRSRRSGRC